MEYIVCKRLKKPTMSGNTNLKYGTECKSLGDIIYCGNRPICNIKSQDAYDYMARNDDGRGLDRFGLTQNILKLLKKPGENLIKTSTIHTILHAKDVYDKRWSLVWADGRLKQFKRPEHQDFWVWNFDFYNAEIKDLEYINNLISKIV